MKTIGLLGGMSWESTIDYYKIINNIAKEKLGGLHSARCVLYSMEFGELAPLISSGSWNEIEKKLSQAAIFLKNAGADFLVICTNTMHKVAMQIELASGLEVLHIADCAVDAIKNKGISGAKIALLGTKPTMEQDFYRQRLLKHNYDIIVPGTQEREILNDIIFTQLCRGEISAQAEMFADELVEQLFQSGCQGIILGCTELGMIFKQDKSKLPLFDTTVIHAKAAMGKALANDN